MKDLLDNIWQKRGRAYREFNAKSEDLIITCSMDLYIQIQSTGFTAEMSGIKRDITTFEVKSIFGIPLYPSDKMQGEEWIVSKKI